MYNSRNAPIIANIGTFICKNDNDYVQSNILLFDVVFVLLLVPPDIDDIDITFNDCKNVFIYELLPATPSWKNIN